MAHVPARLAAARVRVLICDVDGVMTDGGLHYDAEGKVSQRFHVQDGMGVKIAQAAGIEVAVISGLRHHAAQTRAKELGIPEAHFGFRDKRHVAGELLGRLGLCFDQAAFLGDDWVDASLMRLVGLPMAVANAQPEIKALALWVGTVPGGHGAVREAVRFLLAAQGKLDAAFSAWLDPR